MLVENHLAQSGMEIQQDCPDESSPKYELKMVEITGSSFPSIRKGVDPVIDSMLDRTVLKGETTCLLEPYLPYVIS